MNDSSPEQTTDDIQLEIELPLTAEESYRLFTEGMHRWWPPQYTWSGEGLEWIGLEPEQDGRCYERGPLQFECDWGRITAWEPPHRLVLRWQIGPGRVPQPNPAKSSEVELRFTGTAGDGTRVTLTHRNFTRHGEKAARYRAGLASSQGWPFILDRLRRTAEGS